MGSGQFRFGYFTSRYDETLAFYREGLGFPIVESWNRGPNDRGTLFAASSGMIEVLALPGGEPPDHLWDDRSPQGAFMVIEVDDVDSLYGRLIAAGLPIQRELKDQYWGHRAFCVQEPNGLTLYFFHELGND